MALLIALAWFGRKWLAQIPLGQARSAFSNHESERALEWLDTAEWVGGDTSETEFYRARAYRKMGQFEKSRFHLQDALDQGFDRQRVLREQWLAQAQSGQMEKAEPHLARLLSDPRGDEREIAEAYVAGYVRVHRLTEAVRILESWKKDFPEDYRPWFLGGKVYLRETRWKKATEELTKAWELNGGSSDVAFHLAEGLQGEKKFREAREWFQRVDEGSPYFLPARVRVVRTLRMQGELTSAQAKAEALATEFPSEEEVLTELGMIQLDAGEYADAVVSFHKAHADESRDMEIRYAVANAIRGAGDVELAREHFDWLKQAQRAHSKADTLKMKVFSEPDNVDARSEAGALMLTYGNPTEGLIWLHGALSYDPSHQPTHAVLARFYEARKDRKYHQLATRHRKLAGEAYVGAKENTPD